MRVLITGAGGQLGRELSHSKFIPECDLITLDKAQLNICDEVNLREAIIAIKPDFIVNCAAFTNLDLAEHESSNNFSVNFSGVRNLGEVCRDFNVKLIHISTDAVFSSAQKKIFSKFDEPCPINEYGRAKSKAEKFLQGNNPNSWVVRTSWLYGQYGGNFFQSILKSARLHQEIQVITSQYGQPTWSADVAKAISLLLTGVAEPGVYHAIGQEIRSRLEFAKDIYRLTGSQEELVNSRADVVGQGIAPRANFSILESDSNLAALGWMATSIDQAILKSI